MQRFTLSLSLTVVHTRIVVQSVFSFSLTRWFTLSLSRLIGSINFNGAIQRKHQREKKGDRKKKKIGNKKLS
ncbi:hypothetical protein GLYMA_07G221400v4 [Glycine max]|uniref:Uncharacterized protein n=1 Tax=Glycine max TaxID=3847 RepID=K7L363_SOYBN|nr:hypothetical protein GYH30_019217 [Glycine max]KRH50423.1 hypothetical protein GLYMA_07G221400v4 [Glycine max]